MNTINVRSPNDCICILQAVKKKCTENQTSAMIREAATRTDVRKQKIIDLLRTLNPNASRAVQQFGLRLNTSFANVKARVIGPPMLEYGGKTMVKPKFGVWRAENFAFIAPQEATVWGVLTLTRVDRSLVENFCQTVNPIFSNISSPWCSYLVLIVTFFQTVVESCSKQQDEPFAPIFHQ